MNYATLKNWMPAWGADIPLAIHYKFRLKSDLINFIRSPKKREVFTSDIPFCVWGEIYGDSRLDENGNKAFEDGSGVLTSPVKEIRRVEVKEGEPSQFDVYTRSSVYRVSGDDLNENWVKG